MLQFELKIGQVSSLKRWLINGTISVRGARLHKAVEKHRTGQNGRKSRGRRCVLCQMRMASSYYLYADARFASDKLVQARKVMARPRTAIRQVESTRSSFLTSIKEASRRYFKLRRQNWNKCAYRKNALCAAQNTQQQKNLTLLHALTLLMINLQRAVRRLL